MLKYPILLPVGLLLFMALLTFWISQTVQEQTVRLNILSRHDPDYKLYNFVSTRTDGQGHTNYALAATKMQHFPDNDTTELERPRFTQFGLNKPYTQIQGQRGLVSGNGKLVQFLDQVNVTRQATATKGEMRLQTDKLSIEPDKELAYTDRPVVIRQLPGTLITATGMSFDNKADTIQLFNRVHVHYERAPVVANKGPTTKRPQPAKIRSSRPTAERR